MSPSCRRSGYGFEKTASGQRDKDWARTIVLLNMDVLDSEFVANTLNVLLKFKSDIDSVSSELPRLMRETQTAAAD